jgi:hypothetical protein
MVEGQQSDAIRFTVAVKRRFYRSVLSTSPASASDRGSDWGEIMPALLKARLNTSDSALTGDDTATAFNSSESPADLDNSTAEAPTYAAAAPAVETITFAGSGMVFDNTYGTGVSAAFRTAIVVAENFFQSHFTNAVTLNMSFNLGPLANGVAADNHYQLLPHVGYATLVGALNANAVTPDDMAAVRTIPSTDPTGGTGFAVPLGMARILRLAGSGSAIDDTVVLNQNLPWTYGADATGALEHEMSEGALGRIGGLGVQNGSWGPMDLFRYSDVDQRDYTGGRDGRPSFFSVDGTTLLTRFHNSLDTFGDFDKQDFGDWDSTVHGDAFGPGGPGAPGTISATDLRVMDILGWTPTATAASPPANFVVGDTIANTTTAVAGDTYTGPVSGLEHQYINITTDSLNIISFVPDAFIHSGSGTDAIDVSKANGNNILDGSTGSNFLVGGTGSDTFFLDDRSVTANIWSSILDFHSGDNATIWGITQNGFSLTWLNNQGASNAKGLTGEFISPAPGAPAANITLAGFSAADLNTRLSVTFGRSPDIPGLPGSPFMNIHAN